MAILCSPAGWVLRCITSTPKTTCRSGSGKKLKGFEMREVPPGNLPRFFDIGN